MRLIRRKDYSMNQLEFERTRRRIIHASAAFMLLATIGPAANVCLAADQTLPRKIAGHAATHEKEVVDIELLTWPEIYKAIHEQGKTTAILFNGGTEQRGPQGVTGAHNFIAHATADEIARKLGNALVAPVIPYSINRANPNLPGTIGISGPVFAQINEEVTEQLIANGFKNVVLIGDHGGGQKELKEVAAKLDAKYAPQGIRVVYSDGPYTQANQEFFAWLDKNGYPPSEHAGIPDTSELLYLEGNQHWIRKELLPTALGDAPRKAGEARDPNAKRINNGIGGDARRSSFALGKRFIDLKVADGVAQIQELLKTPPQAAGQ
jgi:creatinine amidohydrolase/Fe(II)-dependent formamide hydrolase-like protein